MWKKILIKITLTLFFGTFGWGFGYITLISINYVRDFEIGNVFSNTSTQSDKQNFWENREKDVITDTTPISKENIKDRQKEDRVKIMVAGDLMFDRAIRAIGDRNGYDSLFDISISSLFKKTDIVVANLEGPITLNPSKTLVNGKTTDSFTFTFPTLVAETLKRVGFTIVSLANNHTDNFGYTGYIDTQKYLNGADVQWFGNPWNSTSTDLTIPSVGMSSPIVTIVEKNNIKIALVGYHAFRSGVDTVVAEIKRISDPTVFIIVMPHWGEEYVTVPSEKMRNYARAFINAGANAIIGAHPHVIAEHEWIDDVPVFYSVGNLLFDQYFSKEVMTGMIVELNVIKNKHGISIDYIDTYETLMTRGIGVTLNN